MQNNALCFQEKIMRIYMSEFQQIKAWYDSIKQLAEETNEAFNSEKMILYVSSYYQDALSTLLKKEYHDEKKEISDEEITRFITLAAAKMNKTLMEELSYKYIHANFEKINQLLTQTQLCETEFLAKNHDMLQAYYDTEMMLDNLTYKDHPVESFRRFIEKNYIQLKAGKSDEYVLKFCFEEEPLKEYQSFECNTIGEFLAFCSPLLLEKINHEQLLRIKAYFNAVKLNSNETFDYNVAKELRNEALYQYLDSFEYIRLHFFLEDLYLLLYYDKIDDFKSQSVAEALKQELEKQQ